MTENASTTLHLNGPICVTAIELDPVPADKKANMAAAERVIATLADHADVALLPEMFSTGYIIDRPTARQLAEPSYGPTIEWSAKMAAKYNMAVTGSFIALDQEGNLFNRGFFTEPSGETTYYDKRHLFTASGEHLVYTPGRQPIPIVRFRGWNIALAICYDLRFPVWLRNIGGAYDLLLVAANWPDSREYAWRQLLIARAIENQAYVAGCNRTGCEQTAQYSGTSLIVDPKGVPVSSVAHTPEGTSCKIARLSHAALNDFRRKFPVFLHGDNFTIV